MANLTKDDLEILIEAVDAWPQRSESGSIISSLLTMMITTPQNKEQMRIQEEKERAERNAKKNIDKEIATILKAKLLLMRDNGGVDGQK